MSLVINEWRDNIVRYVADNHYFPKGICYKNGESLMTIAWYRPTQYPYILSGYSVVKPEERTPGDIEYLTQEEKDKFWEMVDKDEAEWDKLSKRDYDK